MGRYSRQISTQKPLTFCSNNSATTMIANEVRAGYSSDDIEFVEDVSSEDFEEACKPFMPAEWTAQEYARNRQNEYPTLLELTVALYDTDDKAALETKRAAVKTKWPKDNSGPVE